jgi:hypothetical protein
MSYSYLGQTQHTQRTTTIVQRVPVAYPMATMPVAFARRVDVGVPGQLYQTTTTGAEIEKELYKDLPTAVKKEKEVKGTNPQKLIKHDSGLEIPAYILQRDIERKKETERKMIEAANIVIPLPQFHQVGVFISQKPLVASLIALGAGYLCGQFYYKSKHSQ